MPNHETKIVCPSCGAEFEIPQTSYVTEGVVIGKDSNLGTVSPRLANHKSAEYKLEALRNAGVDVSNIFSITDAAGISKLARVENGVVHDIQDNDPILSNIIGDKTIPNRRLFRRWIMSQVFHMLEHPDGFVVALQRKGYQYQWKMLIEELRVQIKLAEKDPENFADRNRWFNRALVCQIAFDYIFKATESIKHLRKKKCQGRPYVRLRGRNVFISELPEQVTEPLLAIINRIESATTPVALWRATVEFYRQIQCTYIKTDMAMSNEFKDAYKGAGAFFTMKNMILFHECVLQTESGRALTKIGSITQLHKKADEYATEGWRLFGLLRKFLLDNNVDIQAKMAEWKK